MKHLIINNSHYNQLEQSFQTWLDVLGYAEGTIKTFPVHVREMLHFLEQKNVQHITQVKARHVNDFIHHLKQRSNQTRGGALSNNSINKSIQSISCFTKYINQTGKYLLDITLKQLSFEAEERAILSQAEIKQLYEASFMPHRKNTKAIGQRDRAMIAILYGCGLRKQEACKLNLSDIDINKKLVFVRKGKGNKQRYVPIANKHADDLQSYIEDGRYWFLENHAQSSYYKRTSKQAPKKQYTDDEAFFLSEKGKRIQSFDSRLKYLKEQAGIETKFSTHNLRHSIATHLLQSGMPIEEIAKFLGHSSLESTQIYTHIVAQLNSKNLLTNN